MQHAVTLARTLPPMLSFQRFLTALGRTYHALQQWEEARSTLEEAEAITETSRLGPYGVPVLSQLCMRYAIKAIVLRKSTETALIVWDLSRHYETEALLRGGNERQAREEVYRLGER